MGNMPKTWLVLLAIPGFFGCSVGRDAMPTATTNPSTAHVTQQPATEQPVVWHDPNGKSLHVRLEFVDLNSSEDVNDLLLQTSNSGSYVWLTSSYLGRDEHYHYFRSSPLHCIYRLPVKGIDDDNLWGTLVKHYRMQIAVYGPDEPTPAPAIIVEFLDWLEAAKLNMDLAAKAKTEALTKSKAAATQPLPWD